MVETFFPIITDDNIEQPANAYFPIITASILIDAKLLHRQNEDSPILVTSVIVTEAKALQFANAHAPIVVIFDRVTLANEAHAPSVE